MKYGFNSLQLLFSFFITTTLIAQDFKALKYRTVGPERGGRVTTVTGTPMLPGTFYLGASGGGVWKTKDYGTTWKNISDGYFGGSIGSISVSKSDTNVTINFMRTVMQFKCKCR